MGISVEDALYEKIYRKLKSPDDIDTVHEATGVSKGVLFIILSHKTVQRTKVRYHKIKKYSKALSKRWDNGESLLEISRSLDFPPVLLASFILKEKNKTKKDIQRIFKRPFEIKNNRLRKEIVDVINSDIVYSPLANSIQKKRAEMGEKILVEWLKKQSAEFIVEKESLKGENRKTPDFLLKEPLEFKGRAVFWIDSKATFGDKLEHDRYIKKQFREYIELFGPGLVVYWYGFVNSIKDMEGDVMVTDASSFIEFKKQVDMLLEGHSTPMTMSPSTSSFSS